MNNVPGYILFYGDLGYYMICDRLDHANKHLKIHQKRKCREPKINQIQKQ